MRLLYPRIVSLVSIICASVTLVAAPTKSAKAPQDAASWMQQGAKLVRKGDWKQAIAAFSEVIEREPNNIVAFEFRSEAYFHEGELEKALEDSTRAITLGSKDARTYSTRASIYRELGQIDNALADVKESIRLDPSVYESYQRLASLQSAKGDQLGAIQNWSKSLLLKPDDDYALTMRGRAYFKVGQYKQALTDYLAAVAANGKNDLAHNNLAWLRATCPRAEWRDGKEAVKHATIACTLTKWKKADWLDTLAAAYAEAGDFAKAIKFQEDALRLEGLSAADREALEGHLTLYKAKQPLRSKEPS